LWCRWVDSTPSSFAFGKTAYSASIRGVLNDALAVYFVDATIASAFVARWSAGEKVETVDGYSGSGMTSRRRGSVGSTQDAVSRSGAMGVIADLDASMARSIGSPRFQARLR
jgi:hypothetical protein